MVADQTRARILRPRQHRCILTLDEIRGRERMGTTATQICSVQKTLLETPTSDGHLISHDIDRRLAVCSKTSNTMMGVRWLRLHHEHKIGFIMSLRALLPPEKRTNSAFELAWEAFSDFFDRVSNSISDSPAIVPFLCYTLFATAQLFLGNGGIHWFRGRRLRIWQNERIRTNDSLEKRRSSYVK